MNENNQRNYPPRRRPPKKKKSFAAYIGIPQIAILLAILIAVVFSAVLMAPGKYNSSSDSKLLDLPTEPTTPPTEPSSPDDSNKPSSPSDPTTPDPGIKVTGTATIGATGDMLMHMPCVNPALQSDGTYDFSAYFANFSSYVQAVDYAVANLETTLAGTSYKYSGYPQFNCPDGIIPSLKSAGFDMMLTANNHTYDTLSTGFFRTQEVIAQFGLDHIGTKPDAETDSYLIKDINGIRVGMINYTYETNSDPNKIDLNGGTDLKENEEPLINVFLKDDVTGFSADLAQNIADMEADGAEAIVLYIHWGEEYQTKQNNQQKAMAQAACDLGVDVIVGGHPHVIQPLDLLTSTTDDSHKTVCLYSTGNALSNQRIEHMNLKTGHTEDGIFFSFTFVKYSDGTVRVENVEVLPLWINLYTSTATGKAVYDILPLDKAVTDWQTAFTLTDSTLTQAEKSYERTMKIVGTGLEKINEFLSALPEIE
jgi:poly-gamma-glutamate synthesis protein (capsule biosynthesis protein)